MQVRDLSLVTQRKPLEDVEPIKALRWLLRHYFAWRGFACRSHCHCSAHCENCRQQCKCSCDGHCYASIEYRGGFDDAAAARWAASCAGGAVRLIPFNAVLPEETVSYKTGDVPMSEASPWYRRGVMLPFEAVSHSQLKRLKQSLARSR